MIAPPENKRAIGHIKVPAIADMPALPMEMIAMTPSEELTIAVADRFVYFFSAGTIINPPPTPSNPDKNPEIAPMSSRVQKQDAVQMNFPVVLLSWQGGFLL